jgi:hypothetical protein
MRRLVTVASGLAGVALAVLVLAGCADAQPGDTNPGSGYTNNVSDLLVKVPALRADPCRGTQADQLFTDCGRYVVEVANTVAALRADVPGQAEQINALSDAVHSFQTLACDSAGNDPSPAQRSGCPQALTSIGNDLDRLGQALATTPTSP